jgi:hypothetical protein
MMGCVSAAAEMSMASCSGDGGGGAGQSATTMATRGLAALARRETSLVPPAAETKGAGSAATAMLGVKRRRGWELAPVRTAQ